LGVGQGRKKRISSVFQNQMIFSMQKRLNVHHMNKRGRSLQRKTKREKGAYVRQKGGGGWVLPICLEPMKTCPIQKGGSERRPGSGIKNSGLRRIQCKFNDFGFWRDNENGRREGLVNIKKKDHKSEWHHQKTKEEENFKFMIISV